MPRRWRRLPWAATIIYAGNRTLAEEIEEIFDGSGKNLVVTENLMPEIGQVNPEPARAVIRQAFLDQIVSGKGLSQIVAAVGVTPKPTPLAMYELVGALGEANVSDNDPGLVLIDMGGATTDVYSYCPSFAGELGVVLRGIKEPTLKRSVEGDLGMRVSAKSVIDSTQQFCAEQLEAAGYSWEDFVAYAQMITEAPEYLPGPAEEKKRNF